MEKTISYLNSKIWYRIIKVVFLLIFILSLIIYNIFSVVEIKLKNVDLNKTIITCNTHKKNPTMAFTPKSINLNLSFDDFSHQSFDYKDFYTNNNYAVREILKNCFTEDKNRLSNLLDYNHDIFKMQKITELQTEYDIWKSKDGDGYVDTNGNKIYTFDKKFEEMREELDEYNNYTENLLSDQDKSTFLDFDVKVFEIEPSFTYTKFIKYSLIGNFSIILFFEVIRRTFYYIVLGKLIPKKNN